MRDYTNESPVFKDTIKVYEPTDPVDAETVSNVPLKQLQDNILFLKQNGTGGCATEEEVEDLARELMGETPTPGEYIATDEEVQEAIDNLDDL